ncbi:DEAD/DEAH box helicase family protein [Amycolatopsis sp. WGS_07]|uniref:DEAD/DEAH box helicase family protein n=1 Tax=Amycolatopsis sp. WGS_07 TaxID=3076764 RepID=UPI00387397D5
MLARLHGGSLEHLGTATPSATAADHAILARWSGWGDAGQLFDKDDFARQRQELHALLTEEQYAAASRSTINAHYTDAGLAATIWNGLQRLGFTGGTVLEPGCGSGHFIGLAPSGADMWGVEREPVSAAIARALYPDANVISGPFEEFGATEGFFDAAIGNVPFVHAEFPDRKHNPNKHSVHNGFIIKSLRLVRPGGVVAVLTSRHTLDAVNPGARREIAQFADLLGAVRLPTGAHRRAAGTDAVTDLLILRRRENDTDPAVPGETWEKALPLQIGDDTANVNLYFHQHPEHILGDLALGHGMHSDRELLVRGDLERLDTDFAAAVADIADTAVHQGLTFAPRTENTPRPAAPTAITDPDAQLWDGTLTALPDGTFTVRVGDAELPYEPPGEEADQLRMLLGLRDVAMTLISAERACIDDTPDIAALRAELNDRYDAYHAKHGPVNTFTEGRQLRTGWQVYSEWADRNGHDKAVADGALVRDYLTELMAHGLGQDHLARHLKGIVSNYETSLKRAAQRAAKSVAAESAYGDPAIDRAAMARELADTANPLRLLAAVDEPDPRLSEEAIRSAQALIQHAPKKTDPELDLDDLGLRTTRIIRPNQGGFRDDPGSHVVASLEDFSAADQTARKTDIFRRRVIYPPAAPLGADTAEEALAICLDAHSRVDLAEIARLLGLPGGPEAREALGQLVFDDPDTGEPIWAPLYLGGNVRRKLARAETAAADDDRFAANVEALRKVIPPDLGPADVEVRLGSWIGPSYVTAFLKELLDDDHVRAERVAGLWTVHTDRSKLSAASRLAATRIWGTEKVDAYDLAERVLTGAAIRVTVEDAFDRAATEAATDKAAALSDRFAEWVWEDTARARQILRAYNDLFNSEIEVDYSGIRLSLPGMSEAFPPKDHQRIAIARIVHQGGTGLVHDVGAGKTLEIIAGVMERRRRGLARTPVVVVPNDSIADQFQRDWGQAYPGARVLMGTTDHLSGDKRKKSKNGRDARAQFIANVATRDVDAVIMTKESFESIPMPYDLQKAFLQAELDDLRAEKEAHADSMSKTMTKRIEGAMENAESRLRTRISEIKRDTTGIDFVMTAFDFVVVDEEHYFKNGMVNSSIPGLSIEGSHRAIDLDMKLQYLQDRHGGPRCVLATATPWTGTVSEIYLWLRRLGHDLPRFDAWARTYVTLKKTNEMTPGGNLKPKMRPRRIINEPELWHALRVTSDIKMKEELPLKIPAFRGGKIEVIEVPSSVEARIFTLDAARRSAISPAVRRKAKTTTSASPTTHSWRRPTCVQSASRPSLGRKSTTSPTTSASNGPRPRTTSTTARTEPNTPCAAVSSSSSSTNRPRRSSTGTSTTNCARSCSRAAFPKAVSASFTKPRPRSAKPTCSPRRGKAPSPC